MKLHHFSLFAAGVLLALTGCPKKPVSNENIPLAEGKVTAAVYTNDVLGWSMKIPQGWRVKTREEISALTKTGVDAMQKNVDAPLDASANIELLYLHHDQFNQFTSTSQAFDPALDGPYSESQELLAEVIVKTYTDTGMSLQHERGSEVIGGVTFNVLRITLSSPDGKEVILHQAMYDALLGSRSLTVSLSWNSHDSRDQLFAAWRGSTFVASTPAVRPSSENSR
jgi:hypothetical protein